MNNMSKIKSKNILYSFKYAIEGIKSSIETERNMKIHITIAILVIIFGLILKISKIEWFICIILISAVISAELFNTVLEVIVDMIMPEKNDNAKRAKDIAAGAVLVMAIGSAIIGLMIFVPKLVELFKNI